MSSQPLLQVSDLNVYYGESHILRNVDLSISEGQMARLPKSVLNVKSPYKDSNPQCLAR